MKKRTNSLSVKVRALQSIKKISEECYDLTTPVLTTPRKPLLCQAQPFGRTTPLIVDSMTPTYRSAQVPITSRSINYTSRSIANGPRLTSAFQIESPLIQTQTFCNRVYTTKLIQKQAKQNCKQKDIFIRKLSKAVVGDVLNATGYELGPLCVRQICDYLLKNNIKDLVLDRNNFKDDGILQLAKVASKLKLRILSLASVNMTEKGCKALLGKLSHMQSLQQLNISSYQGFNRNKLHKDALQGIQHLTGSQGKANLKVFKCDGVGLDDNNFKILCQSLNKESRLQHLSVSENQITSQGMVSFQTHVVKVKLKYFDCSNNKIQGGGMIEIASLIGTDYNLTKISKSLTTLKICKAKIRSNTIALFAKQMANNQILEELYLDCNPLGEGHKFNLFSNYLSRNWAIKRLSLCQSLRSTEDVLSLCDSIENNRGLEVLMISRNNLEYCAFKKLLEKLAVNKSIKKLYAQSCGIVDSFVTKAQDSMLQLKYLEQLYLDHNYLNDNGAKVIEKTIFKNKSLFKVRLYNNPIGIKMQKQVEKALSYNVQGKKFDGPDLTYYKHVQQMQNNHKAFLQQTINQLKQKQHQLHLRQLVHNTAKKEVQTAKKATEIHGQIRREVSQVQKIVMVAQNLKKAQEFQAKAEKNKFNESLLMNDSQISLDQFSNLQQIQKGVSIQIGDSCNFQISQLDQTH